VHLIVFGTSAVHYLLIDKVPLNAIYAVDVGLILLLLSLYSTLYIFDRNLVNWTCKTRALQNILYKDFTYLTSGNKTLEIGSNGKS
jgi:hypothetical protein